MRLLHPVLLVCLAISMQTQSAFAGDGGLCASVKDHLLPERLSRDIRPAAASAEEGGYLGHWIKYTEFCFDCGKERYVLGSGIALFDDHGLHLRQNDLFIAEYDYFIDGAWQESGRLSGIDRSASMQNDKGVKALSRALFYMEYGKAADDFFRSTKHGTDIVTHLPRYGIRGSDIRYWYECQSCKKDVPAFTYGLSQDLRYTRLASYGSGLAVITTRPRVVIAMLEGSKISYHECPKSSGPDIERSSTFKE